MNHLTASEIKSLLREIPDTRQRLMLRVAFLHGLRVSEVTSLTRESIRDGYVAVQRLKGSLKTIQPYVAHADPELGEAEGLTALYDSTSPGETLFPMTRDGVLKLMKRAGARAGLPTHKCHPHILKHSCAMSIIGSGIENTKQYLGHKSLNSTGAYLRVSDEMASKAAAKSFGGLA